MRTNGMERQAIAIPMITPGQGLNDFKIRGLPHIVQLNTLPTLSLLQINLQSGQ